jgi:hypothetical protein
LIIRAETTVEIGQLQKYKKNLVNPEIDSTRQLSVVREREIACNLAFISATSDDRFNVMAVCVEEHCNARGSALLKGCYKLCK